MRTTISIHDDLLQGAKLRAAETNRTLAAVIEDALRLALNAAGRPVSAAQRRSRIPVSGEGGLMPGVDLDDTSDLLDRMEGRP